MGQRALVASCADWAVICTGRPPSAEVAVIAANRVVAVSPAARAAGARTGMRRREVQSRCPDLEVVARDMAAEARNWEPALAAVEAFAPGVEVLGPGRLALGARGPARYFGGDEPLAAKVAAAVEAVVEAVVAGTSRLEGGEAGDWTGCCRVGVADGLFAATLAAQLAAPGRPLVVARDASAQFLAPLPVRVLAGAELSAPGELPGTADIAALADLLVRLGIKTLGDFAALPAASVLGRFGTEALVAHRLARGLGGRSLQGRLPPPDWVVAADLDPPADQLHAAVFVGRALAEQLHARLVGSGLVCTRLAIEAQTEYGTSLRRSWRHDGALSAAAIGERVRWQLEGWAQSGQPGMPGMPGGPGERTVEAAQAGRVTRLALVPEEVRPDDGRQLGFWGGDAGVAARAARALARVQGLLGPEAAVTAVLQGGRDYSEQVVLVPWGEPRTPLRPVDGPPWPGRLPGMAPAIVHRPPLPAQLMDGDGGPISVGRRGGASAAPACLVIGQGKPLAVNAWAGPWPLEERWWDGGGRRRARLQACTADGAAYLLACERQRWWVEATYD
jgi:protein ImuB